MTTSASVTRTLIAQDILQRLEIVVLVGERLAPDKRMPTTALLCTNSSCTMRSSAPMMVPMVETLAA